MHHIPDVVFDRCSSFATPFAAPFAAPFVGTSAPLLPCPCPSMLSLTRSRTSPAADCASATRLCNTTFHNMIRSCVREHRCVRCQPAMLRPCNNVCIADFVSAAHVATQSHAESRVCIAKIRKALLAQSFPTEMRMISIARESRKQGRGPGQTLIRQYLGRILGLVLLARGHRHPTAAVAGHDAVGAGRLRDAVAAGAAPVQVRLWEETGNQIEGIPFISVVLSQLFRI